MGIREDYMAVRRAATRLETETAGWDRGPDTRPLATDALVLLLRKASANELAFLRLTTPGVQAEVIDLAYALLGETRAGGRAVQETGE